MEDILAIVLIFGGGTAFALAMSPIGRAIAARIQGGGPASVPSEDVQRALDASHAVLEEVEGLRRDIGELQERVDFTERMLARQREDPRLPGQAS
ncbi:MAG: hypothetical protein EXR93_02945 [Gemmatimonadetes bacterium]|nr:hypothetical protein [Gemmatimonadota bacterium]